MQGEWISLTMSDGHAMPCYHVAPEGERRGGLVLVQEIFGVTEHIREMCEEYASDGYEVISPQLFDRQQPGCNLGRTIAPHTALFGPSLHRGH